jgi:hypothetical protein
MNKIRRKENIYLIHVSPGWVDEYGRWHSGATAQTIVTSVLAIPAALAVGLMAL